MESAHKFVSSLWTRVIQNDAAPSTSSSRRQELNLILAETAQSTIAVVVAAGLAVPALALVASVRSYANKKKQKGQQDDGIAILPSGLLGNLLEVASIGPYGIARKYMGYKNKEVVRGDVMGPTVFVAGNNMIAQLIQQEKCLEARWIGALLKLFHHKSILASNGPSHDAQRRVVLQSVSSENLTLYYEEAEKTFMRLVDSWLKKDNAVFNVYNELVDFSMMFNGRFLLGDHVPERDLKEIQRLFVIWKEGFQAIPIDLPFTTYGKGIRAREAIADIVEREVNYRERIGGRPKRVDVLQLTMEAKPVPGSDERYTREDIRAQLPTVMFGAMDTTIGTEIFIMFLAGETMHKKQFENSLEKVREELLAARATAAKKDNGSSILGLTYGELLALPFLRAFVDEALRMSVPGPMAARKCIADMHMTTNDGREFTIHEGDNVWVQLKYTTETCGGFQFPDKFDPARFLPPRSEDKFETNGAPWFGFGKRMCPGQTLARLQLSLLVAALAIKRVRVQLDKAPILSYKPSLLAEDGIYIRVTQADVDA